jgi:hypothetical protein
MFGRIIWSHVGTDSGRLPSLRTSRLSISSPKIVLVTYSAVNSELTMPISSVRPKPLTSSEPNR